MGAKNWRQNGRVQKRKQKATGQLKIFWGRKNKIASQKLRKVKLKKKGIQEGKQIRQSELSGSS